ncbi:ABC transporter permease [Agrococcus carbonis]|uniref:Putative ABC transport system permease protein n=1 Tax=Agrococcus carbonis TaxID=684552 RepID=A0A1H1NQR7_9MICO|nr:ABC transporter permease [Agrococcus carbonis]SDS01298.1 putative ABC transport system permease protein [Agrococcus carbonis]
MRAADVLGSAVRNTFRSKLRTSLTVIAIVIGAFTLSITSAIGAGVSSYIDAQLGMVGAPHALVVTPAAEDGAGGDGPREYDPERSVAGGAAGPVALSGMSAADFDDIAGVAGVERVQPIAMLAVDFIETAGSDRFELAIDPSSEAMQFDLAAGSHVADVAERQLLLPTPYVEALGFADAADAVGATVTLGVTDAVGQQHEVTAVVAGVAQASLLEPGAESNQSLTDALVDTASTGRADSGGAVHYAAVAFAAEDVTDEQLQAIKDDLAAIGFQAMTVDDQIGMFRAVIDGIVNVLNAFAIIALIAAGFGIVNTLLMSVQERTREIGLMKAMGMGSGRVFGLFTTEAVFIGLLGSAIGAGLAIVAGTLASGALAETLFAELPGLQIMRFEAVPVLTVMLIVMAIAFLAGTLPARRAARQHPIEALRYE